MWTIVNIIKLCGFTFLVSDFVYQFKEQSKTFYFFQGALLGTLSLVSTTQLMRLQEHNETPILDLDTKTKLNYA